MKYADIIVDISHENIDRVFQYRVPSRLEEGALVGVRVNIPFGAGNRLIKGYIVGLSDTPSFDINKMKNIDSIVKDSVAIENQLIALAYYIKDNFGGTINDALKAVIPVKSQVKDKVKRYIRILVDEKKKNEIYELLVSKKSTARMRFIEAFEETDVVDYELITKKANVSRKVIDYFVANNFAEIMEEKIYRNPVRNLKKNNKVIELTDKQSEIAEDFVLDYYHDIRKTYLIHGVTGSGKTEVYMRMIEAVISKGRQVIVLIPEISLTYQTVLRFYNRFGDRISILNSRMSPGERYDQYVRAKDSDIDIMIGPRSALFTPFDRLGLIIIDEEHESSYKNETVPKYHAREVAIKRARMCDASVVLGSATPSLDAYYRALNGEYKLYKLNNRANNAMLPQVHVVDLREELKSGNKSIFSRKLKELIDDRLEKKEQVMLFINRRGYSGFVSCRSCGHVMKCPHCDVSLTFHNTFGNGPYKNNGKLVCHYCGYETAMVNNCPECNSNFIALFGTGTQKIEEMVNKAFPSANVLRMDADTTSGKNGHENILSKFADGEADILVGTQMIVKGHDFANVTLVGILAADLSMNTNDYRAAERTFQLLTQASGRAGRGKKAGEVVIQTYRPEHYSIETAAKADYVEFYEKEILFRTMMKYPPVSNVLVILMVSADKDLTDRFANEIVKHVRTFCQGDEEYRLIGPADATLSKANDLYRKVIYIKSNVYNTVKVIKDDIEKWHKEDEKFKKCNVYFDFNPISGY